MYRFKTKCSMLHRGAKLHTQQKETLVPLVLSTDSVNSLSIRGTVACCRANAAWIHMITFMINFPIPVAAMCPLLYPSLLKEKKILSSKSGFLNPQSDLYPLDRVY